MYHCSVFNFTAYLSQLLFFKCQFQGRYPVAALGIDKVGPRPYYFRSALPLALSLGQEAKKSKISVIHSLAVLKGHKCGKTLCRPGLRPGLRWGELTDSLAGGVTPFPTTSPPHSTLRASNLGPSGRAPCLPKSVYQSLPM